MDYRLDYRKYKFHADDIYAFGRLIEIQAGRMFAPEHIGHPFIKNGRWSVIFSNLKYDMWKDSDYQNISFLSPVGHMWKGKEEKN